MIMGLYRLVYVFMEQLTGLSFLFDFNQKPCFLINNSENNMC